MPGPNDNAPVTMVLGDRATSVPASQVEAALAAGWRIEDPAAESARLGSEATAERNSGVANTVAAGLFGVARGASLGLSDAVVAGVGGEDTVRDVRELREAHPYASLGGEIVGALLPGGGGSLAARAGEGVAGRIAGEGALRSVGRKFVSGAVEGGIQGLGTGVSELALSDDPLTVERIASTLSTGALLGGGIGGGFNVAGHGLSVGLAKTSKKLREFADATPQIVPAPPPEFPGAPKFEELPPAPPPPKRKRPAGAPEPKPRGPYEEREMLVADLDDVRMARFRELREARKLGGEDGVQVRVEAASNLRAAPPSGRKSLPASHPLNKPIDVVRDADGKMRLVDGYVRLASMPRDAKIKVRFRRGDASAGAAPPVTADNLANLDAKALREARQAELEALEGTRVADRAPLAEDVLAYRRSVEDQKLWLATEGATARELKKLRKLHLDADKAIERVAKIPKALADNPNRALIPLQAEEHALEQIVARMDEFGATGARAERMAAIPKALEQNRALQKRIIENAGKQTSRRLDAIDEAMARLSDKAAEPAAGIGPAGALGIAATLAAPLPVVGGVVVAASSMVGRVAQKTRKVLGAVADRSARAIDKVLDVSAKAKPILRAAPVVATRILARATFGGQDDEPKPAKGGKTGDLATLYRKRSAELRSLTALGPDGLPMMRREARARVAAQLAAFGAISPLLADRIETLTARKVEFLAGRLPRRPDLAALPTGPDRWQPSDMQMRTWARYVAAVEDPGAIEERLADGSLTPEDAEVMREVYPERMEALKAEIVSRLPQLQRQLPYHRRLALSIFSGVPVDPAMNPQILRVLQSAFVDEPGSEGGTMAPQAMPAFGSVRSQEKPTPAQRRAG